jgi:hypothetical protein
MQKLNITLNGHSWAWIAHIANKYNLQVSMSEESATLEGAEDWTAIINEIVEVSDQTKCEVV